MAHRDIYLRIEPVEDYSPLAPECCSRRWGNDCMRNPGHELGRVTAEEIFSTTLIAMVYRQYTDHTYSTPVTDKIVAADANEPPWHQRVPGCVLWAEVGDTLAIHVKNADPDNCHSFHLHGLRYGIDSDGAWPLGIQGKNGTRSDDIHPGGSWTYHYEVTDDTVGVWAFHDHHQMVQRWINQGLFGALIVRDPCAEKADHEIPMFVHQMSGNVAVDGFESPPLSNGGTYQHTFGTLEQSYPYHCKVHGVTMAGTITVKAGGATQAPAVVIKDNYFDPPNLVIEPGATVNWFNQGKNTHIVFFGGGGGTSFCLNGRTYVGNTPTIEAHPGQRLRWYIVSLDVNETWHNFHPHSMRWQLPTPPGGAIDVHPLSPLEGFTIDTIVPEPLRLPHKLEEFQHDHHKDACRVPIRGDFLFHCHIESHMMSGLSGLVRSKRHIWIDEQLLHELDFLLPLDDGDCCIDIDGTLPCGPTTNHHEMPGMGGMGMGMVAARPALPVPATPPLPPTPFSPLAPMEMPMPPMPGMGGMSVDDVLTQAAQLGAWEMLPCDSVTLAVHFALLHTGKVLIFSGSGNYPPRHNSHTYGSVIWDYEEGTFTKVPITYDMFCAGQASLPSGNLLTCGGTKNYDSPWEGAPESAVYDAGTDTWHNKPDMADGRWYPTLVSLGDGTVMAFSGTNQAGNGLNEIPEVFHESSGTWSQTPSLRTPGWPLYPHLFLKDDGRLFFTGGQLGNTGIGGQVLDIASGTHTPVPGLRLPDNRDQGASILLPPAQDQKVMLVGGLGNAGATPMADIVDLSAANPSYQPTSDMFHGRTRLNAVILPDRTVFVSGGGSAAESQPVLESEIYDPSTGTWSRAATATVPRLYHSVALLLPDGRVATAGSNPDRGDDELRIEIFHPPYLFKGARPFIEQAPSHLTHGHAFTLDTPNGMDIMWVQLIRPMATTHSTDTSQRLIDLPFERTDCCTLEVHVPNNPNLAPPGWYMLSVVDMKRRPSDAKWVKLG